MASVSPSHMMQLSPSGIIITNAFVASQKNAPRMARMTPMNIQASVHVQVPASPVDGMRY